jgi:hypothetical protein
MRELIIPQAEQAERAVLGCLLFAPHTALPTIAAKGLTQGDFHNPQFGAIFAGIQEGARTGLSLDPIGLSTHLAKGGIPYSILSELSTSMPSLEPLSSWCDLVQDAARRRTLLSAVIKAVKAISSGEATEEVVAGLSVATLTANAERGLGSITQSTFNDLLFYDTENDSNTLIGNRWLCKGGSVLINAQSGIGKSSLTMQLAIGWALHGIGAFSEVLTFGLIPVKPLKSLILQAENDQGDQAEILQSVFCKYGKSQCGETERQLLNERLVFYRDNVHSGVDFIRVLETLVMKHQPDIVWIDPLMCYLGDDISDQAVVTKFCNELNRISTKTGVLLAVIHHLPKPRENGPKTDSDLAYAGFGSSALTNWAREVITLQRVETPDKDPLTCSLTMTKRRLRSEIKCFEKGIPTSKIYIRHSPTPERHGMIWQQCLKPVIEKDEEKPKRRR